MPHAAQVKLLRVLQAREVVPVGGTIAELVDVRVICATHQNLRAMLREGRFREDLYARIADDSICLPPLRERKEDIYRLCRTFLAQANVAHLGLSLPFMTALLHYDFPRNVRELDALIRRAATLSNGKELTRDDLPGEILEGMAGYGLRPAEAPCAEGGGEGERLRALLEKTRGNVSATSRELGVTRATVHRWMKRLGIDPEAFRESVDQA